MNISKYIKKLFETDRETTGRKRTNREQAMSGNDEPTDGSHTAGSLGYLSPPNK